MNNEWDNVMGEKIRAIRKTRGITQKDLGFMLSRSDSIISAYENGVCMPNTKTIKEISEVLGMRWDLLMDDYLSADELLKEDSNYQPKKVPEEKILFIHGHLTNDLSWEWYKDGLRRVAEMDGRLEKEKKDKKKRDEEKK